MSPVFIFLFMLFCHIVDDYVLQGCLANLKQKGWWRKHESYKELYKYDYIVALICHSISWTFMVMLPLAINQNFDLSWFFFAYPINIAIHAITDDQKANKGTINLICDQLIHFAQISLTFMSYVLIFMR